MALTFLGLLAFNAQHLEVTYSVSVKEILQRVTDAWPLKFVRQQENFESQ